jgi:hypothetical protein
MEQIDQKNRKLEQALSEVKTLRGLLPICASCKNIRDDKGYWGKIEGYLAAHSDLTISHGMCPDCMQKLYPDLYAKEMYPELSVEKDEGPDKSR